MMWSCSHKLIQNMLNFVFNYQAIKQAMFFIVFEISYTVFFVGFFSQEGRLSKGISFTYRKRTRIPIKLEKRSKSPFSC